jgi:cell division septation protein DedD
MSGGFTAFVLARLQKKPRRLRLLPASKQSSLTAPVTNPNDPLVRWVVQLGVFNDSRNAQKLVEQLRSEGMTAYSETMSGKPSITYRVRVGPFLEHEEAIRTQQQLSERQNIDGVVMTAD